MSSFKTLLVSLLLPAALCGQQTVPFAQFWVTQLQTNPATAGLDYKHHAYMTYNSADFGDQLNANAAYAMKINRINSGVGVSYSFDASNRGTQYSQAALLHYAYHFDLGQSTLSLGASGGVRFYALDWDKMTYGDLIAPQTPNDPLLPTRNDHDASFDASTGIAYKWKDLHAGFSITQFDQLFVRNENSLFNAVPLYWLSADYTFHLPAKIDLRPQYQVMTDHITFHHMGSLTATYANKLWISANYRHDYSFGGMIGYDIKERYRMGFGYNLLEVGLLSKRQSSFQIVLAYLLK
jgi:type IX secretion system PorP/SprF family membrane protein